MMTVVSSKKMVTCLRLNFWWKCIPFMRSILSSSGCGYTSNSH